MPIFKINPERDIHQNAEDLAAFMCAERVAMRCRGYCFDFDGGEMAFNRNAGQGMRTNAFFMAQYARNTARDVKVFRNMNGEIAARLC